MLADFRFTFFCLVLIILSCLRCEASQSVIARVQIKNEPPSMYNVHVTPVFESNFSQIIWCFGVARDRNSVGDISYFNATITGVSPDGPGAKLFPRIVGFSPMSNIEGVAIFGFIIPSNFSRGEYQCEVVVRDSSRDLAISNVIFNILPASCNDKVRDGSEEGVDCGGGCVPCSCLNDLLDYGEDGVDCGGPCKECSIGALSIHVSKDRKSADKVVINVQSGNTSVQSAVRLTTSDNNLQMALTDSNGSLGLIVDSLGVWEYQPEAHDYVQVKDTRYIKPEYVKYILYIALFVGSIACLLYYNWHRNKSKPFKASPE